MLRPERMSRVSVTGTKRVMTPVIEAIHELNLLHLASYDGSWEGFTPGDPMAGADGTSEQLVTVRSIESILGVDDADADGPANVTEADIEAELADVRAEVNALDDRRSDLRDDLRSVEDRIETAEPFLDIGIDLDLLSGYDTLAVRVGEGDAAAVRAALDDADDIDAAEVFAGDDALAVFAHPADEGALDQALVGAEFAAVEIPDAEGPPGAYVAGLEEERERLEAELATVQEELEALKTDAARFLLGAEERLSIEVQKAEAPLRFATTENAFVAEGWIPTDRYADLEAAVASAVGDRAEVEELERAEYEPRGGGHHPPDEAAVAADGGTTMGDPNPPVVQDNPRAVKPFELLVETINRPRYWEFDPSVILFLTFPIFFGFMIGDLGYGLLYMALGYALYARFDSDAIKSLGGIAMWAGGFTVLFGILYGELFGLHLITEYLWHGVFGLSHAPIEKGLSPAGVDYARAWLVVALLVGLAHVGLGHVLDFVENYKYHGAWDAVTESGSWLVMLVSLWWFVFSTYGSGTKPEFLYTVFDGQPFALGFAGLPAIELFTIPVVGLSIPLSIVVFVFGAYLLYLGEPLEVVEVLQPLVNILSYARIPAVLLAKAGMAFTVNLLVFGAYTEGEGADTEFHFALGETIAEAEHHAEFSGWLFQGLFHPEFAGVAGVVLGLVILVIGHLLVLALGVTSAGLQAVRLEYVEFFGKFYDGGGEPYQPFGHEGAPPTGE